MSQNSIPIDENLVPKDGIGFGPSKIVVPLDPISRIPIGNVPFDRTFIIRMYLDPKIDADGLKAVSAQKYFLISGFGDKAISQQLPFYLISNVKTTGVNTTDYDSKDTYLKVFPQALDIVVPALLPNKDYRIIYTKDVTKDVIMDEYIKVFKMFYAGNIQEGQTEQNNYKNSVTSKNQVGIITANSVIGGKLLLDYYNNNTALKDIIKNGGVDSNQIKNNIITYVQSHHTYAIGGDRTAELFVDLEDLVQMNTRQYTVETSAGLDIVADGGLIFTGFQKGFNTASPYIGINLTLRPMDSDIPFKLLVRSKRIQWYQRFTVNCGLTLNSIAKASYRANLFGNDNVMIGGGYKFSHVINLGIGGLIYNNVDPNPLLDKKTIGVAPYVQLSINLKIKSALGAIANVFTYGK